MALPVTHAAIVVTGITSHVIECRLFRDIPSAAPDYDGHLSFIVEPVGHVRFNQRLAVSHLRTGIACEDGRIIHVRPVGLLPVHFVIQADTKNFLGSGMTGNSDRPDQEISGPHSFT